MKHIFKLFSIVPFLGCAVPTVDAVDQAEETVQIGLLLDGLHEAAANAQGEDYFNCFHEDGVFIGTDKTEYWTIDEFKAYADPHFSKGTGWAYRSTERHIVVGPDGQSAWFYEKLVNDKYGDTRGSGALIKEEGRWQILQYVLSFSIPNAMAGDISAQIRQADSPEK